MSPERAAHLRGRTFFCVVDLASVGWSQCFSGVQKMTRLRMNDKQWQRIQPMIPDGKPGGRPPLDRRTIIDGIPWILRTGAPWRDIPEAFGKWQTVWRLFDQWNGDGTLDKILQKLQGEIIINTELWCIDGTVISPVIPSKSNEDREARPVPFKGEAYRKRNIISGSSVG